MVFLIKNLIGLRLLAVCLMMAVAGGARAEDLTLDQCIQHALSMHPDLVAAQGTVESYKAQTSLSAVGQRLQASGTAGYTRSGATAGSQSGDTEGDWATEISLSQTVFDWGKTGTSVKSSRLMTKASEETLTRTREEIVADVRDAYYGLNLAERDIAVQREQMKNYEKRLSWAKSYYAAGTKAKIEVTNAETDLANTKLSLIKAISSAEQYRAELASAMGDPALQIGSVKDELDYEAWNIALSEALDRAALSRSDLTAQELEVQRAAVEVKSAALTNAPDVTAGAGYSFGGSRYFDEDQWNARLTLTVPVGDGGETKALVAQAKAELKVAQAERDKLAQDIILDVRKAWQSLQESAESIVAAEAALKQAKENLDLALGRYRAGVGDSLEVSDAVDTYATAQTSLNTSLYDHKAARLSLERAMGEVSGS